MSGPDTLFLDRNHAAVRRIGPWLRELLSGLEEEEVDSLFGRLELAVHEVCVNSVDHADLPESAKIRVTGSVLPDAVTVVVSDDGKEFDSSAAPEPVPGEAQIRGYGLFLVRRLVNEFDYHRTSHSNMWILRICRTSKTGSSTVAAEG
jgi:anti-sigma regulatory factor (Ser/Thr protein kinase)